MNNNKQRTLLRNGKIDRLAEQGLSQAEIARRVGITKQGVNYSLRSRGLLDHWGECRERHLDNQRKKRKEKLLLTL